MSWDSQANYYSVANVIDGRFRYPHEWVTNNEKAGAWILLGINNQTSVYVSKFVITPKYTSQNNIPKRLTVSCRDESFQVLVFDCSLNFQSFKVNKTVSNTKFTMQGFCVGNSYMSGFGEIEAFGTNGASHLIHLPSIPKIIQHNNKYIGKKVSFVRMVLKLLKIITLASACRATSVLNTARLVCPCSASATFPATNSLHSFLLYYMLLIKMQSTIT